MRIRVTNANVDVVAPPTMTLSDYEHHVSLLSIFFIGELFIFRC